MAPYPPNVSIAQEKVVTEGNITFAQERYKTCKSCENFIDDMKVCTMCACFMPVKVFVLDYKCPLNKWLNEI